MFLYPIWVRLWHLVNAILILILIFTGITIYFPEKESSFFIMDLSKATGWHDVSAKILIISYLGFLAGNIFTGNGKYYRIEEKRFLSSLFRQLRYYLYGKFKHEKNPFPVTLENKFNPLQKLSYIFIMYIALPLIILSGVGLMLPDNVIEKMFGAEGYFLLDIMHIIMATIISLFLIIHIYLGVIASKPTAGLRGIITGYVESEE
jgi:thiosulfate reductase cytochrome b subunit